MKQKILEIITNNQPIKAKDIAALLPGTDQSTVNALLYGELRTQLSQDNNYNWRLKKEPSNHFDASNDTLEKETTLLAKMARYYFDCISRDLDTGISEYATSNYGKPKYTLIETIPSEDGMSIAKDHISHLQGKLWKEKGGLSINLGYPILVERHKGRDGGFFHTLKPLLIQRLHTSAFRNSRLVKTEESIIINPEAFKKLEGYNQGEMLSEILHLNRQLGLDADTPLGLDEVALRLQDIRAHWPWKYSIGDSLSLLELNSLTPGIYNSCGVFLSKKSKYTLGLEDELDQLSKLTATEYKTTALDQWLSHKLSKIKTEDRTLLAPLPLNEEQRQAVLKGLQQNLSVVTGPPGTGKSQVVTSLIVNAVYEGQKVLFASKNNKAVDVVLNRVNGLTKQPVMLRLGGRGKQVALASFLTGLIASNPDGLTENRFKARESAHKRFAKSIAVLNQQLEDYIALRNTIDQQDIEIEEFKMTLGEKSFAHLKGLDLAPVNDQLEFDCHAVDTCIEDAKKENHNIFKRLFWSRIKKQKLELLGQAVAALKDHVKVIFPDQALIALHKHHDISARAQWYADTTRSRLSLIQAIQGYYTKLRQLSSQDDIFELTKKETQLKALISANSLELWQLWIELLPKRINQDDKRQIGDYLAILNLITASVDAGNPIEKRIWAQFYSLQSKVTSILTCWGVTSLSVKGKIPLKPNYFDLVIIDEASQCDIASALPLLFRAKRVVIIGDDKQLTHISAIHKKQDLQFLEKHGIAETHMSWSYAGASLFQLATSLCHQEDLTVLRDHHRSHAHIINYANTYFYNGSLRVATDYATLKSPSESAVRWIDISGKVTKPAQGGALNQIEAVAVVNELKRLVANNYEGTMGVVTPFRAQANRISDIIHQDKTLLNSLSHRNFLVDTVHKFQGDERDTMLFSPVIAEGISDGAERFLARTGNLFNVAITRARAALIVVGDMNACKTSRAGHFSSFAKYVLTLGSHQPKSNTDIVYTAKYPQVAVTDIYSEWEVLLYEALYKQGIQTQVQYKVDKYSLDLALIEGTYKLDIEVDGETYHRSWDGELLRRDKLRNKRLIELGWDVQRFWVYELREDLQGCIAKIKHWQHHKQQLCNGGNALANSKEQV